MKYQHYIVIFHPHTAEYKRVPDVEPYRFKSNILINPSLKFVKGVEPRYWKQFETMVIPMTEKERKDHDEKFKMVGSYKVPEFIEVPVTRIVHIPVDRIVEKLITVEKPVVQKEIVPVTPSWVYGTIGGLLTALAYLIWGN